MSHRILMVLGLLTVVLAGGSTALAERLGSSYRGPEDAKTAEKEQSATDTGTGSQSGGGAQSGGDSGEGGGMSSGGDGGSGGDSGTPAPGGDGGSSGGDSGPTVGGGGDTSTGKSSGGTTGGGSDTGAAGGGAGAGPGGRSKTASAQDQFYVVSWYFEHNRERLIARYLEDQGRRIKIPSYSSAAVFGVLPRDARQRSEITSEDRDRIFDILKKHLQLASEDVVRDAAVIALGKLGTPPAVELLKQHVAKEHRLDVKQDTLLALGLTRSADAIPTLVDAIRTDKGNKVTSYALLALGLTQDSVNAGPAVLDYFTVNWRRLGADRKLEDPVAAAAVALGVLRHAEAEKVLAQALASRNTPDMVKCYVAQALGRIGGDAAGKALVDALAKGGQEVERAAALALGGVADGNVAKVLGGKEGIGKADQLAAGFAAVSLGRVLDGIDESDWKSLPEELHKLALAPEKGAVKSQYANLALALFSGFDKAVRDFYVEKLEEGTLDKDTKSALAMAAGLGGIRSAQPKLVHLAKDAGADPKTRGYAALAIGMLGQSQSKDVAKTLREIYKDNENPDVRRGALMGLAFVGDRADVGFLCDVVANTKEDQWLARYTRGAAVIALGMIRDGESIARIQDLTGRPDARTRAYALAALGYLADKDPVPVTSELFENANFRQEFGALEVVMRQL